MKSHRGRTHKRRKGETRAKKGQALTIPQLRKCLEHISSYSEALLQGKEKSLDEKAKEFAEEWSKVFHKKLELTTARAYIEHIESMKPTKGKKRGTRKMRGGNVPIAGAPLAYLTRPGLDLPYGKFPEYVNNGFWNPEPAPAADCATFKPVLPTVNLGSNKMYGGGVLDTITNGFAAINMRPFAAENPASIQGDAMNAWKGLPLGPGGASYDQAWNYRMGSGEVMPNPSIPVYNRTLQGSDVVSR